MRHLFLPAQHSERDLVLAGQISDAFGSAELYVTWSGAGAGAPTVAAAVRDAATHPARDILKDVALGIAHLWSALIGSAPPVLRRT